jgi:nitrogen PTS system EIIA component
MHYAIASCICPKQAYNGRYCPLMGNKSGGILLMMDSLGGLKEVMTLEEVADYLQVSQKSILRMAQTGKIPAAKVASQWRFMRSVVDDWLMAQMEIPSVRSSASGREAPSLPELKDLIPAEMMNLGIQPGPKKTVLEQLIEPLKANRVLRQHRRFLDSLMAREEIVSTAIGHGIAIPHPHRPLAGVFKEPFVTMGVCREGTNFEALDHQRTYVFFLLCAPTEDVQLRLLTRVTQVGRQIQTIEKIRRAPSPKGVSRILTDAEDLLNY